MDKPTLLVMAAGIGSRFGGPKQIAPLGPHGELIIDYSLFDARLAGFGKVIFVVRERFLEDFRSIVEPVAAKLLDVSYVTQEPWMVPSGFHVPSGRIKPWGTGHAVLCAENEINGNFGVLNADDFYGRDAIVKLGNFLSGDQNHGKFCMVGFPIENTLSDNGTVSRGICVTENKNLINVTERVGIARRDGSISYLEGEDTYTIPDGSIASMNVWGINSSIFPFMNESFASFLETLSEEEKMSREFYLPYFIDSLIKNGSACVKVLSATSHWYGITYREDATLVSEELRKLHEKGEYPPLR